MKVSMQGLQIVEKPATHLSRIQVPLTKNLESSTWNLQYTAWNPESKTVLDSLILHGAKMAPKQNHVDMRNM